MELDGLALLHDVADAVGSALRDVTDWGPSGRRVGQYAMDIVADDAALAVLARTGLGVLSEESGFQHGRHPEVVVIDPVDGSTNASRGVPYYATAMCVVDGDGPATAMVANPATGVRWWATRGGGAFRDGEPIGPSACTEIGSAIVGLNGLPPAHLGYAQSRVFGAVALDLCMVASGVLDGYVDCIEEAHGVWDHAASVLICREAGASITDLHGRDLVPLDVQARRTPVAAATPELLAVLVEARRAMR